MVLNIYFLILYVYGSGGMTKTRTRFGFFFFLNPYPTLLFIGLGKIRSIRVGPDQVPTDRA